MIVEGVAVRGDALGVIEDLSRQWELVCEECRAGVIDPKYDRSVWFTD